MKAVVYKKNVLPERLVYCDVDKPIPNDNEVLVKVIAASANAADYRSIKMGIIKDNRIIGSDIAGIVEAVGKDVKLYKYGDEVIGDLSGNGSGGFAEYAVALEKLLVHKPQEISFEDAAALPMAAVTALQALRKGKVHEGHVVLIIGSSGGVGTFAIQLAKYFGASITAVCGPRHLEQTSSLGADRVIDYTKEDFTRSEVSYDIVVAVNGNYSLLACRRILNPNGSLITVGGALAQIVKSVLLGWAMSIGSRKIRLLAAQPNQKDLEFIVNLARDGKIRSIIDARFPLEKTADAMRYLSAGHAGGKVLINVKEL